MPGKDNGYFFLNSNVRAVLMIEGPFAEDEQA